MVRRCKRASSVSGGVGNGNRRACESFFELIALERELVGADCAYCFVECGQVGQCRRRKLPQPLRRQQPLPRGGLRGEEKLPSGRGVQIADEFTSGAYGVIGVGVVEHPVPT